MNTSKHSTPPARAQTLGYGGLIPFAGLAWGVWFWPAHQAVAACALVGYSATIVSFLGAIHWGLTMRDTNGPSTGMLLWGVVPSLLAWVALLLPAASGLLLTAAALWACFAVDRVVYTRLGLCAWLPMRLRLSAVASACCMVSAAQLAGVAL